MLQCLKGLLEAVSTGVDRCMQHTVNAYCIFITPKVSSNPNTYLNDIGMCIVRVVARN
jgi:hypothetical protein